MSFAAVLERLQKLENPFPGLRHFDAAEAHLYYGRDPQIAELVRRLERQRFLAVVGVSGSGKSSLVLAGLVPALERRSAWRVIRMRPQADPYAELSRAAAVEAAELRGSSFGLIKALGDGTQPVLLVVDQFEELFRFKDQRGLTPEEKSREAATAADFVQLLLTTCAELRHISIVITMRSDYLGACAEFRDLPEALNGAQYLVPRLTREQLRQAIEGPLGRVKISPALVQRLLNDVGDDPGRLPLLQHALMCTWDRWKQQDPAGESVIEIVDYEKAGCIECALDQHAEELLRGLPEEVVRIVFQRLTAHGSDQRERRDPATVAELRALCQSDKLYEVLNRFRLGGATFLTPREGELKPDTYIDITHESLLWSWGKLRQWIDEEQKSAKMFLGLIERADRFRPGAGPFLVGLDLSDAIQWRGNRTQSDAWAAHYAPESKLRLVLDFISASEEAQKDAEILEAGSRHREQQRKLTWLAFIAAAILAVLVFIAGWEWRQASKQQKLAESREFAAKAETLVSSGMLGDALKAAIKALSIAKTSEAREAIAHSFPQELTKLVGHSDGVFMAAFSPDGTRVLTASLDHTARVWNAATGQPITTLAGPSDGFTNAAFSPDGQRVVTASWDHTARVWDSATGRVVAKLEGHADGVSSAAFSPDGGRVVTASWDHTARVWDAAAGRVIAKLEGHAEGVSSAAFSPDGQRVVTASADHTARVWNAATGLTIAKLEGHADRVSSAAFSPNGRRVVTASWDHTARVWDAASGATVAKLEGHAEGVSNAAFSPDGQRVATASADKTARVWNAATGEPMAEIEGHAARLSNVAFSPDGQRVVTASEDHTAMVWNVTASGEVIAHLEGHSGGVLNAMFSPDGERVATVSADRTARVWNAGSGELIAKMEGHAKPVHSVAFSPDGQRVATASLDNTARVWNADSGQLIAKLEGHSGFVWSAAFSADGGRVVTASADHTARVWNAATGQPIAQLTGHSDGVLSAVFSPDGQRVATASADDTARVWNAATGQLTAKLEGHADRVSSVVFSPDGLRVATASWDHTARVWDAVTGRLISKLEGHSGNVSSVAFSPDGQRAATASADHTARVWNVSSGQIIALLEGHADRVSSVAFSPDGQRVATASADKTARVWNARTGQVTAQLEGHSDRVYTAAFSPDGQRVVTASADKTARIFRILAWEEVAGLLAAN